MSYSKVKCSKFDFGSGSVPDLAGRAYSTFPGPLAGWKAGAREGRGEWRVGEGRKIEGEKRGRAGGKSCVMAVRGMDVPGEHRKKQEYFSTLAHTSS